MPDKHETNQATSNNSTALNSKILSAEKRSVLIGLPVGLISGLIAYFATSNFPVINGLVIGIGAFVLTAMLLFYFHFGKDLPKRVISPEEYGSPLDTRTIKSGDSLGTRAYNLSNGNPSSSFILPNRCH